MPASILTVDLLLTAGLLLLAVSSLNLVGLMLARLLLPPRPLDERLPAGERPEVLIQLPLFNEGDLIDALLAAVRALDWPRERLTIQVLDDSTDPASLARSRQAVADARAAGLRIELLHRTRRTAFKAGALAEGLERSTAPYVAIFDADFRPPPDFLRRTVGILYAMPRLAFIQTRWGHLNREHSLLTRVQARLLDAHFRVEQEARWRLGLPVPFNGTCGVWRRRAIDEAGGWEGDTLTEDLDLSLRARLRGWRSGYLDSLVVPGLLPVSPRAWRVQQFRWTKGFAQCFVKLVPRVWSSPVLPLWQKLLVTLQTAQPLAFLVGGLCVLLGLPFIAGALVAGETLSLVAVLASTLGFLVPTAFLSLAGSATLAGALTGVALAEVAAALLLTTGLLLSNARAGLEALVGHRSEFVRTPKGASAQTRGGFRMPVGLVEIGAGLGLLSFALLEQPVAVIYLAIVIGGLLGVGTLQLLDRRLLVK